MSLRFGYALGLHLRNEVRGASAVKKETLGRIWWGIFSLEGNLSVITGRPSVGLEFHCSVPPPLPLSTQDIEGKSTAVVGHVILLAQRNSF